jgi:hypothetical protein
MVARRNSDRLPRAGLQAFGRPEGLALSHLEFRLSITFARFRYSRRFFSSATTVSMVTPDTPFSKSFRHQALPSRWHSCLAFLCIWDIGLAYLVVESNASATRSVQSNRREQWQTPPDARTRHHHLSHCAM